MPESLKRHLEEAWLAMVKAQKEITHDNIYIYVLVNMCIAWFLYQYV